MITMPHDDVRVSGKETVQGELELLKVMVESRKEQGDAPPMHRRRNLHIYRSKLIHRNKQSREWPSLYECKVIQG